MKTRLLFVFGTRPEGIKLGPLIQEFRKYPSLFELLICVTGQHKEMVAPVLELFAIKPDYDLAVMKEGQDLYDITARILVSMRDVLTDSKPNVVVVHGDTVTSTTAALAAFYQKIDVAHVEAGLRTGNRYSPWPEETYRQLTSRMATFHFAPTQRARENLLAEGIHYQQITVTGNTVIDALQTIVRRIETDDAIEADLINTICLAGYKVHRLKRGKRLVLITGHRRENFGQGILNICCALKTLSVRYSDTDFVYPVHLNPTIQEPVWQTLGAQQLDNIFLISPLDYLSFVYLMKAAYVILTDSGGIQEEAPSLGKPVLVMRDTTERPEAIEAGTVKLVGTEPDQIIAATSELLDNTLAYETMAKAQNPFGDGTASAKIVAYFRQIEERKELCYQV
ncbi:non-hydrolyzing UDP-N-acetylglucosamine 2-epimerase [Spirosoma validum]|uniref:UDP-N-acetylglucosamine 2-epimerase (non-hydrolyzing) n=1 Tax=Spirosoma validum TaxID=2771355 RepID=A0A927AZE7_9BACT|nr:UDP-N-acetylglucosamine 2-epimerase (non-hydrolyzing) [Spirosoma validum]MBD2752580.1 UDP-N-acetylglucosamine 2-epimerase (non-hydrolyzing) [Spirosoma validum]